MTKTHRILQFNYAKLMLCKILLLHCFGYLCQSSPSGQIHCYKLKVSPPAMYIYILHNLQTMIHCYDTQLTTPQVSSAAQLVTPTRVCCPSTSTVAGPPLSPKHMPVPVLYHKPYQPFKANSLPAIDVFSSVITSMITRFLHT